jgi:hypothetical protein
VVVDLVRGSMRHPCYLSFKSLQSCCEIHFLEFGLMESGSLTKESMNLYAKMGWNLGCALSLSCS